MQQPPTPDYDYEVKRLVKAYEQALKDVQNELQSLMLTDFKRAQVIAAEKQIQAVLADLAQYGAEWAAVSIEKSALDGIASSLFALGAVVTFEEAQSLAKFSRTNRRLVDAAIADTQADLLAVTQNMNRQSKLAIRKATAKAMRETLAKGDNATSQLSRKIRNEILGGTDSAIIDAAGRRWKVGHYADVIARTNMMNAHREASMTSALEEGAMYGRISRHGATDACAKWEGRIVKLVAAAPGDYPFIDDISRRELFHPQCKHLVTPLRDPSKYED